MRFGAAFLVRFLGRRGSNESFWPVFVVAGEHDMDDFELRMWRATVERLRPFCSVSPAVAPCACTFKNSTIFSFLLVLLFGEAEFTVNNTIWAVFLTLLRNVESPRAVEPARLAPKPRRRSIMSPRSFLC